MNYLDHLAAEAAREREAAAVPEEWAAEVETLTEAEAAVVDAEILGVDPLDLVAALVAHDDPQIREAAAALQVLIARRAQYWRQAAEIERLTVERDHLTARIEELRAGLDEPAPPQVHYRTVAR